jgi:hypothetical protein
MLRSMLRGPTLSGHNLGIPGLPINQRRRMWGGARGGVCPPSQVLGYHLTLFGPRGQIMPAISLLGPPSIWTMRRLWQLKRKTNLIGQWTAPKPTARRKVQK